MSIQPIAVALPNQRTTIKRPFTPHTRQLRISAAFGAALAAFCATLLIGATTLASPPAQARPITHNLNIPAQDLGEALKALSAAADEQLLFSKDVVSGKHSTEVKGEYSTDEALAILLRRSGLRADRTPSGVLLIRTPTSTTSNSSPSSPAHATAADPLLRLAQNDNNQSAKQTDSSSFSGKRSLWSRLARAASDQQTGESSQSSEKISEKSSNEKLGEVIVTAQKRSQRLQDVPTSVAVIGAQDIERRGLIGMEDYLRSIPGVNQIDNGSRSNAIVIRGITTSPEFENFSSGTTVASYFDETPITAAGGIGAGGIDVRPVDIERIELLRGPQGTTYGSASLGGTLRIIPARPRLDSLSGNLAGSYSDTSGFGSDNSMIQGVLNIPIVKNKFAVRAVGYRYDVSGFYRNIAGNDPVLIANAESYGLGSFVSGFTPDDIGRIPTTGGRLAALWQATDKLNLSMNFLTQKIEEDGTPYQTDGQFVQSIAPVAPQGRIRGEAGDVSDTKINLANVVLNYTLEWAELTSAVSSVDSGSDTATGNQANFLGPYSGTQTNDFESVTAETRLASRLPGRFQFLAGVFYENVDNSRTSTADWPGTPETNPLNLFGLPVTNPLTFDKAVRGLDQRAAFGEVSYRLTDKLTATVGGRVFKYDKDETSLQEGGFYGVPLGAGVAKTVESSKSDSSLKADLSYKPTDDSLLYASWSEGFRLGRPDLGLSPWVALCDTDSDGLIDGTNITIESTQTINSDFLDNYELGAKFALFDRRMTVDTSVYHIVWDGMPIRTVSGTCPIPYVANAGAATSDGVEFQASVFLVQGLRLDFGGGYTEAQLSEDAPALGAKDGARLPGSPRVNANLAAQYDFDVAGYQAFVRADSFYTGEFFGDLLESTGTQAGDYIKVDARAGVALKNLSVELFVRNLTNEDAFTWRGLSDRGTFFGYRIQPRTVGIQLGYTF